MFRPPNAASFGLVMETTFDLGGLPAAGMPDSGVSIFTIVS